MSKLKRLADSAKIYCKRFVSEMNIFSVFWDLENFVKNEVSSASCGVGVNNEILDRIVKEQIEAVKGRDKKSLFNEGFYNEFVENVFDLLNSEEGAVDYKKIEGAAHAAQQMRLDQNVAEALEGNNPDDLAAALALHAHLNGQGAAFED